MVRSKLSYLKMSQSLHNRRSQSRSKCSCKRNKKVRRLYCLLRQLKRRKKKCKKLAVRRSRIKNSLRYLNHRRQILSKKKRMKSQSEKAKVLKKLKLRSIQLRNSSLSTSKILKLLVDRMISTRQIKSSRLSSNSTLSLNNLKSSSRRHLQEHLQISQLNLSP